MDSHVHIHDCFEVVSFLDTAASNFAAAASDLGLQFAPTGCLMLTESRGVDNFARLADGATSTEPWRLGPTDEPVSLVARRQNAAPIVIIAGRQIVCRENLEVLGLGTRATFADGEPLRDMLELVIAEGAIPVVPWGVGKWHGARGRLVAELIQQCSPRSLYLGDNGGRLRLAPRPRLFADAESRQIRVLPGSDPLPFAAQLSKVAAYGFVADVALDPARPFAALRAYLDQHQTSPKRFGQLETLPRFLWSQLTMQIQKRHSAWGR